MTTTSVMMMSVMKSQPPPWRMNSPVESPAIGDIGGGVSGGLMGGGGGKFGGNGGGIDGGGGGSCGR